MGVIRATIHAMAERIKEEVIWKASTYGEPVHVEEFKLTPQAESIGFEFPFGGLAWSRPVAVFVEKDGVVKRTPIVDVTRVILWLLWGMSFVFSAKLVTRFLRRRTSVDE